jgi:hypothetical protein
VQRVAKGGDWAQFTVNDRRPVHTYFNVYCADRRNIGGHGGNVVSVPQAQRSRRQHSHCNHCVLNKLARPDPIDKNTGRPARTPTNFEGALSALKSKLPA